MVLLLVSALALPVVGASGDPQPDRQVLGMGRPLVFEENLGQAPERVRFFARGTGHSLRLTASGWEVRFHPGSAASSGGSPAASLTARDVRYPFAVTFHLEESSSDPDVEGLEQTRVRASYLMGNDPDRWVPDARSYARVGYRQVYPGVDLVFYSREGQLEYDFVVAAGADPGAVRVRVDGVSRLEIDGTGRLTLHAPLGTIVQAPPRAYQEIEGRRVEVSSGYRLAGADAFEFQLGAYDRRHPLVIDPILHFSTYLGGAAGEMGVAVAVDAEGNTVAAGRTQSLDFPLLNEPDGTEFGGGVCIQSFSTFPCGDVFVSKFDPDGNLLFSTFLGGSEEDWLEAIALDGEGNIVLAGWTQSVDFPLVDPVPGGAAFGGEYDAFVVRLEAGGSRILSSTYLGGSQFDAADDLALAADGSILVAGSTFSDDFPGFDPDRPPIGSTEALLVLLDPAASEVRFALTLGGSSFERALAVDLDAEGDVLLAGVTRSDDLPVANALQPRNRTGEGINAVFGTEGFVAKLDSATRQWIFVTYLGGLADDEVTDIAAAPDGTFYVAGETNSINFHSVDALQPGCRMALFGCLYDAFVARVAGDGSALLFSTFLGGGSFDTVNQMQLLEDGSVLVGGLSRSRNFPLASPLLDFRIGLEGGFLSRLAGDGSRLLSSTHFPMAIDGVAVRDGSIHFVGSAFDGLPLVNPAQPQRAGADDAFVARIAPPGAQLFVSNFVQSGSSSRVAVANLSDAAPADVTLEIFDRNGDLTPGIFQGQPDEGRVRLTVPAAGLRIVTAGLERERADARVGAVRLSANREIGAFLINDVADPELSLPIRESHVPARAGRRFIFPVEPFRDDTPSGPVVLQFITLLGLDQTQLVEVAVHDASGRRVAGCRIPLPARASVTFALNELGFDPMPDFSTFSGTVVSSAESNFSAELGLFTASGLANFPPVPLESDPPLAEEPVVQHFAQFVDGAGVGSSRLVLVNADPARAGEVEVEIRDSAGNLLPVRLGGTDFSGSGSFPLEPGQILDLRTSGSGPLRSGSVRVSSRVALLAMLVLDLQAGGSTVLAGSPRLQSFSAAVQSGSGFSLGLALAAAEVDQTVRLELRDGEGAVAARAELPLAAGRQVSRTVGQFAWDAPVDFSDFVGTLRVVMDEPAAAAAIWITPPTGGRMASELAAVPLWVVGAR